MMTREELRELEQFVLTGAAASPTTLERAGLAGLVYRTLQPADRERSRWQAVHAAHTARHLLATDIVSSLLRAWSEAGIEALMFKGFYLASLEYDEPAQRPYADIDIGVRMEACDNARRIARELGWSEMWCRTDSIYRYRHEEATLVRHGIVIELHRLLVDCATRRDHIQRRITDAVWEASSIVDFRGAPVRRPSAADSILVGIILARAWAGGDDWNIKPTDITDMRVLAKRHALTRDDVLARARSLRCERSCRMVLQRCDPWLGRVELNQPRAWRRHLWYAAVTPERGHLWLERVALRLARVPGTVVDTLECLPLGARTLIARGHRIARSPEQPQPSTTPATRADRERVVRGVRWMAKVLMPWRDSCDLRSSMMVSALKRRGVAAWIHSAQSLRDGRQHTWVTFEGQTFRDMEDEHFVRPDDVAT